MAEAPLADDAIGRQIRDRLGDKWSVPVVYSLARRPLHFGELSRALYVTAKVLTGVLRSLERDGLVCALTGHPRDRLATR